jgi:excisionase family DNA binding protein
MTLDKSRAAVEHRALALKAAYDKRVAESSAPVTVADLAEIVGLPLERVRKMLCRVPWWTAELAQAAKQEAYRREYARRKAAGALLMQAARAARKRGSSRRKLSREQAQQIRARLAKGATMSHLAAVYQVQRSTIYQIKHGLTWKERPAYDQDEGALVVRVCPSNLRGAVVDGLVIDPFLWERLGYPARVQVRRRRGQALTVEPAAEGEYVITQPGSSAAHTIILPLHLVLQYGFPRKDYVSRASLVGQRLYLSDFPAEDRANMLTMQEAGALLQCSRQWLEYLIGRGRLPAYFDGSERQRVVQRADLSERWQSLCLTTIIFAGDDNYTSAKTFCFLPKRWRIFSEPCKRSRVKGQA